MNHSAILGLAECLEKKQPAVLVTVIESRGASPAKIGAQLTFHADRSTVGTVGGGKLEAAILTDAATVLQDGQPCRKHYRLAEEGVDAIGTLCGGEVDVFLQPYLPPAELVIVGGGQKEIDNLRRIVVFVNQEVISCGGKISVPAIRKYLEKHGVQAA
jgi:xanthine/CO dehydrogenase XdhC/CoxF family maturation factor